MMQALRQMKVYQIFKDCVMHDSESFTDGVTRKGLKVIYMCQGSNFSGYKLNRNLIQFRPSVIHYQPDLTARNGSLDIRQPEMSRTYHTCVLTFRKAILKRGFSSNCQA